MEAKAKVNHYLFYVQTLINEIEPQYQKGSIHKAKALEVSSCLVLAEAWKSWLCELSALLKIELNPVGPVTRPEHETLPDIELILSLKKQNNSWLSELMKITDCSLDWLEQFHESSNAKVKAEISGHIQLIDTTEPNPDKPSSSESLSLILGGFKDYVGSVRERQTEW